VPQKHKTDVPNITPSSPSDVSPPGKPAHPESAPKRKKLLDQYIEFLGKDVKTTLIYAHALRVNRGTLAAACAP
jgi:hypothetical protein